MLDNVLSSNQSHLDALLKLITNKGSRKVSILGLAFWSNWTTWGQPQAVAVAEIAARCRSGQLSVYDAQLNCTG